MIFLLFLYHYIKLKTMKRLLIFVLMLTSCLAQAQTQECNTMWPYIYPEFIDGVIHFSDGQKAAKKVNVHLQQSSLHYLDKGLIKHTDSDKITSVEVGEQSYIFVEGTLMRVDAQSEFGYVGTVMLANFGALNESTGAYGTTSNVSATQELTSSESIGGSINGTNHMLLHDSKESGQTLSVESSRYIVMFNKKYKATKSGINRILSKEAKKEFKLFEKNEKIDWQEPQSILKVTDFLKDNI